MSAEADAILEEAYRILSEEKDWCQGEAAFFGDHPSSLVNGAATAVCVLGATSLAAQRTTGARGLTAANARVEQAAGLMGSGLMGSALLAHWNDDPHTTKEDVLLALKRARYDFGDAS